MIRNYDEWKTTPPEDAPVGHCECCGEGIYDNEFGDFCSQECVMEFHQLEVIQDEKYCECCGEGLTGWDGYLTDPDGNLFCDIHCYLKYIG